MPKSDRSRKLSGTGLSGAVEATSDKGKRPAPSPRAQVRFWGVRGTCAVPGPRTVRFGGNTPCVEVRSATGALVILDAGTGIRALGQRLLHRDSDENSIARRPMGSRPASGDNAKSSEAAQLPEMDLFLSHRHSDHVVGLAHFSPLLEAACKLVVRSGDAGINTVGGTESPAKSLPAEKTAGFDGQPAATSQQDELSHFLTSLVRPPLFPNVEGLAARLEARDWPDSQPVSVGDLCVYRHPANHPGGAAVVRIDDSVGPLLAYAPDNELALDSQQPKHLLWLQSLKGFLKGVPLLIHDAMYTAQELPALRGWGHSSTEEAVQLALDCDNATLALFHHHPDRDDDAVEKLVETARKQIMMHRSHMQVLAASEGLTLPF